MTFIVSNEVFPDGSDTDLFERNFGASMSGTLTSVPGLVSARLLAPSEQDRGYLSLLEFTDEEAYSQYLGSEAFAAAHNWPDHAPISRTRLTTYQTVVVL